MGAGIFIPNFPPVLSKRRIINTLLLGEEVIFRQVTRFLDLMSMTLKRK